jgi:hypothetical protein
MGLDQVVAERHDLVNRQLGARVRIEKRGLVDRLFLLFQGGLDGQQLHIDVRAVQGRACLGQVADLAALHAVAVHHARDLDDGFARKIRNQAGVHHVAADSERHVGLYRLHDI